MADDIIADEPLLFSFFCAATLRRHIRFHYHWRCCDAERHFFRFSLLYAFILPLPIHAAFFISHAEYGIFAPAPRRGFRHFLPPFSPAFALSLPAAFILSTRQLSPFSPLSHCWLSCIAAFSCHFRLRHAIIFRCA